ncbi:MAG: family 16 glycosylhydrolase [Bacteroidetes bacterium]|nr:family 16 glycosylhydrolase [Bacteroidota bacterium]
MASSGSLSFAPGETEKTVTVTILTDAIGEGDEEFELVLSNPVNATISTTPVLGTIRNDDGDIPTSDDGYTTPESYPGYTLVWQDEFNGTQIDPANWIHETGPNWFNNELQNYTDRPVNSYVSDGKLVIKALKENLEGREYTSARMITKGLHEFKYGRIDIRAKLPIGQGIWPALWMLGSNIDVVGWPKCGEIDNMELIGKEPSTVYGTPHWDNNGSHASYTGSTQLATGTFADKYHVFTIIWTSQSIKWLLDDVQFHVIDITPAELSEFRQNFFFIFNVAVGGDWPGNPDASTVFPKQMEVDYVRVFQ